MLAYQNPTFQTTIEKPIDIIKQAIKTVFIIKKTKYTVPENNELLNTFSCRVLRGLTLVKMNIQLEKVDDSHTIFKVEVQSPLGGGSKEILQLVLDSFLADVTDAVSGKFETGSPSVQFEQLPKNNNGKQGGIAVIAVIIIIVAVIFWIIY